MLKSLSHSVSAVSMNAVLTAWNVVMNGLLLLIFDIEILKNLRETSTGVAGSVDEILHICSCTRRAVQK